MTPDALIGDRYRLVRELGSGGMSVVWEARDERLDRTVAVKLLRLKSDLSESEARIAAERAMREARIHARLHHPHVVGVFDVVECEGQPALIMELVTSETLAETLREHGRVEPAEAVRVGVQVASALAAAHSLGIVHRDIKPSNILLGEDGRARISDFGISRAFGDTTLTTTGMINGTPAYLAPEVARGENSTAAADVFSLGSTLYAAVEGNPPFGTDTNAIALLYKVAECDIPTPQRAGELAPLLAGMLAADPGSRPGMDEVTATLSGLGDGIASAPPENTEEGTGATTVPIPPPTGARPQAAVMSANGVGKVGTTTPARPSTATSPPPAARPPAEPPPVREDGAGHRRRGWLAAAAAAVVLVAAVAVATLLWPRAAPPNPVPNVTAVPADSGRSERQSEEPTGDDTDAGATERTDSRETSGTDEPTEADRTDERSETGRNEEPSETSRTDETTGTSEPTDEATESDEPSSEEPSESEPSETQSSEGEGDG